MATIDNIQDFIRILDENPHWLEEVRSRLITRELLELPQVVTELAESHVRLENTLQQFIETTNRRFDALEQFMEATNRRFDALEAEINGLSGEVKGLRDEVANIKGFHAREIAIRMASFIPRRMGFRMKDVLSIADISNIVDDADTSDISEGDLISFEGADLIMKVTDSEGADCYVVVEVSYTIYPRDTSRAIRNAEFLTRFTGLPARPAVAGIQVNWRAQDAVDSPDVFFYRLPARLLKAT